MISMTKAAEIDFYCFTRVTEGYTEEQAFDFAKEHFGIKTETLSRYLRKARELPKTKVVTPHPSMTFEGMARPVVPYEVSFKPDDIIGVIGDTHEPFCHKDYLGFVSKEFEKHGVTKIVHIGDFVDCHAISRHISEPNAMGAELEYEQALKAVAAWTARFPEAILCSGNHDSIPARQAKELGIPEVFMKNTKELWNLPHTWQVVDEIVINDVYYKHGVGNGGIYGAANLAKNMSMSSVMGHLHSCGFCHYLANPVKLWFGLAVGCGIDIKAYAFRYGKALPRRPILGCGIVKSPREAHFCPMELR